MVIGPYYLLVIALASAPTVKTQWRIEGGYDSCLLAEQMVKRYAKEPLVMQCIPMNHEHR